METQSDENINSIKDIRQQLEARIESQHKSHIDMLSSVQSIFPNLVSSLDLSLKVLSSFNHRPFSPTPPLPPPPPLPNFKSSQQQLPPTPPSSSNNNNTNSQNPNPNSSLVTTNPQSEKVISPLSIVRSMVAVCLLGRVPFSPIDSSTVLRKLENDQTVTQQDKAALQELGGDSGAAILAVEIALRSMADDNGAVELEEFVVSGKSRIMVLNIDRIRLLKELPETAQQKQELESGFGDGNSNQNQQQIGIGSNANVNGAMTAMGRPVLRPMSDMWMPHGDPHMSGLQPMFSGGGRGAPRLTGMLATHRGIGIPSMHRLPMGQNASGSSSVNVMQQKPKTLEEDMKDLVALLNKKSFREMQKSKTGEELLDLIHRPTARETAVAAKVQICCLL